MNGYLLVGLGGAFGAMARFAVSKWASSRWPGSFPAGTFIVNFSGSVLLGLLVGPGMNGIPLPKEIIFLLAIGFMGSFTTFSTFSVEVINLTREKGLFKALYYPLLTLIFAVFGATVGLIIGMRCVA